MGSNDGVVRTSISQPGTMIIKRNGGLSPTSIVRSASIIRNQRAVQNQTPLIYERFIFATHMMGGICFMLKHCEEGRSLCSSISVTTLVVVVEEGGGCNDISL